MTQGQSQVKLLRVTEFAKAALVTPRTLRFYQSKGLLEPYRQDEFTGYRYYHIDQIHEVMRIKWLQELGLSLDEIAKKKGRGVDVAESAGKIKEKIRLLQSKLDFLIGLDKFLSQKKIKLKRSRVGGWRLLVYSVRKGQYHAISGYVRNVWQAAAKLGLRFEPKEITFYETFDFRPLSSDLKIGLICRSPEGRIKKVKLPDGFRFEKLDQITAYRFVYKGPYRFLTLVYQKLNWYFVKNKIAIKPPVFEVYIKGSYNSDCEYDYLTEIYYPVG
ncbi:MAG: MerR family transcriptional regulator [bacterium]|nr:MerR family transcriptional regulator [bacterium]